MSYMDFLQANNFKDKINDDIISCFEHEYEKEGVHYMDIYVHAAGVTKVDVYSALNCKICLNILLRVHPKGLRNEEKV